MNLGQISQSTRSERERRVREGLRFIIKHLDDSMPVWALGMWIFVSVRTASGKKEQKFRLVKSEEEALAWFKAANYLDCRIRAYHDPNDNYTNIAPSTCLVDLDREYFSSDEELELCVMKTRANQGETRCPIYPDVDG